MPSRRAFLSASGAVLLAGCLGADPTGPTDGEATDTPDDPRTEQPPSDGPTVTDDCYEGFHVTADPFDPATDLPQDVSNYPDKLQELVDEIVESGSVEIEIYDDDPPLADGLHLRRDGAFHRIGVERIAETAVTAYRTNLEWGRGQTAPDGAEVVAYADLPESDRQALELLAFGTEYERPYGRPQQGLSMGEVPAPYPDGADDSQLVGAGTTWVRWDDRTYEVEVTSRETTVTRRTFELAAETVADESDAFRERIADRYLVELGDLPDGQREVLAAAAEDRYEECAPASEPLANLQTRLEEHDTLPPNHEDSWYVAFEGERYELDVLRWVR